MTIIKTAAVLLLQLLFLTTVSGQIKQQKNYLPISGKCDTSFADSVYIALHANHYLGNEIGASVLAVSVVNTRFNGTLEMAIHPSTLEIKFLKKEKRIFWKAYYVFPGDNIHLNVSGSKVTFSGTGANGLAAQDSMNNIAWYNPVRKFFTKEFRALNRQQKNDIREAAFDSIYKAKISVLQHFNLPPAKMDFLKKVQYAERRYRSVFGDKLNTGLDLVDTSGRYLVIQRMLAHQREQVKGTPKDYQLYSEEYLELVYWETANYLQAKSGKGLTLAKLDIGEFDRYLKQNFPRSVADRVLVVGFSQWTTSPAVRSYIDTAIQTMTNPYLKSILLAKQSQLKEGAPIYDFALTDTSGKTVRPSDLKGKVILIDFYFNGCVPCMQMKTALEPVMDRLKKNPDFLMVSVSADKSRERWMAAIKSGKYVHEGNFLLYTGEKAEKHPFLLHYGINKFPTLMLIDKKGIVRSNDIEFAQLEKKAVELLKEP